MTARRKQYEYYRDKLLTFDVFAMGASDVVWRALGEIADIRTGRRPKIVLKEGFFEYINAGTSNSGYTTDFSFPEDTVTTPSRGQGELGLSDTKKILFGLAHCAMELEQKNLISFAINFCITFFAVIVKRYYKRKMRGNARIKSW